MPDTVLLGIPAVELAQRTDSGRDPAKQVNEDAVGCRETIFGHLCVVCDGMGGHAGGREASTLALQTIFEVFEDGASRPSSASLPASSSRGRELLRQAVALANRKVFGLATESAVGRPGSTVVAILLHATGTEVAHVGDSRCYRVHQGQISQVTRDHSMVQELVDAAVLTPEQAALHPEANKITRALGMNVEVDVEVRPTPVAHLAGDVFVLCSDGLSDLVGPPDIVNIAATAPAAQAAGQLVDLANARGGYDNISVVVLRARETALASREPDGAPALPKMKTEAMLARTVATEPPRSAPIPAVRVPAAASYHASEPPAFELRRASASVVLAVVLGLVGLAVGAIALWFVLPHHKNNPAAPFALDSSATGATGGSAKPSVPSHSPEPVVEPPAAPLPSLVPSPQHHLSRRPSAVPPVYP